MAKRKTQGWQLGFNPQMKKGNAQRATMFSPYRLRISRMFQRLKGPWMVKGHRQHTSSKWPKWTCKWTCISTIYIYMVYVYIYIANSRTEPHCEMDRASGLDWCIALFIQKWKQIHIGRHRKIKDQNRSWRGGWTSIYHPFTVHFPSIYHPYSCQCWPPGHRLPGP